MRRSQRCPRTGDLFQQIVFHQLTRQLLCHRLERLTCQSAGGTCGTRGSAPHAVATESPAKPPTTRGTVISIRPPPLV